MHFGDLSDRYPPPLLLPRGRGGLVAPSAASWAALYDALERLMLPPYMWVEAQQQDRKRAETPKGPRPPSLDDFAPDDPGLFE